MLPPKDARAGKGGGCPVRARGVPSHPLPLPCGRVQPAWRGWGSREGGILTLGFTSSFPVTVNMRESPKGVHTAGTARSQSWCPPQPLWATRGHCALSNGSSIRGLSKGGGGGKADFALLLVGMELGAELGARVDCSDGKRSSGEQGPAVSPRAWTGGPQPRCRRQGPGGGVSAWIPKPPLNKTNKKPQQQLTEQQQHAKEGDAGVEVRQIVLPQVCRAQGFTSGAVLYGGTSPHARDSRKGRGSFPTSRQGSNPGPLSHAPPLRSWGQKPGVLGAQPPESSAKGAAPSPPRPPKCSPVRPLLPPSGLHSP